MGNNPSSQSKPTTPVSSTPTSSHQDSPRQSRRESKHIIPPRTTERVAAPPEASLHQAHGSTISKGGSKSLQQSIPIPGIANYSPASSANNTPPPTKATDSHPQQQLHRQIHSAQASYDEKPSKPVDVPVSHTEPSSLRSHASAHAPPPDSNADDPALVSQSSVNDMSYLTRPPRLPLPIEEEVHTPGSPIIAPVDASDITDAEALDSDVITRKSSGLSNATAEEEDGELPVDKTRPTVPTRLEWRRGGDKIYVTGTIFQWNRKQRLHPVDGKPGIFAATVHILPGTHHVRFLVDGIMQTSPDLPTTVDFGNNLVNYIEISADDLPTSKPVSTSSSTAAASGEATASGAEGKKTAVVKPTKPQADEQKQQLQRGKSLPAPDTYFNQVPQYLKDYDQAEETPAYKYAVQAIEKLPDPPSLPSFLGKPILNAAVLMKDDNSVLNMPNHTVLNHLATSSIKNNVLAVSATTRYKNKYVTTIIYKPTPEPSQSAA